jgi:hypothetical protein
LIARRSSIAAITFGDLIERQFEIEDLAGIDPLVQHQLDQPGQVAPYGRRSAVQMNVRVEQIGPVELDTVRHSNIANESARTRRANRLHHGFLRTHALAHAVRANSFGQLLNSLDASASPR